MSEMRQPYLGAVVMFAVAAAVGFLITKDLQHLMSADADQPPPGATLVTDPALIKKLEASIQEVRAVDGDTIIWRGRRARLRGIDAFELGQPCYFVNRLGQRTSESIDCGERARIVLQETLDQLQGELMCMQEDDELDFYGRPLIECLYHNHQGELQDLVLPLIKLCYAFGTRADYAEASRLARTHRKPVGACNTSRWSYDLPWVWRKNNKR